MSDDEFWPPWNKKECPWRATKMEKGREEKAYEEQVRSLGLFSREQRRLRGRLWPAAPLRGRSGGAALSYSLWTATGLEGTSRNNVRGGSGVC